MAEIGCNWARIGPSKSPQSCSIDQWAGEEINSPILKVLNITHPGAPSTSQPHLSPTLRSSIRQETETYEGLPLAVTGLRSNTWHLGNIDITLPCPMIHLSPRFHTLGSDEGRMQPNKLMDLVTKLSDRVVALETDLTQTNKVYGADFTKLIKKVKRLEKKDKLRKSRRKLRLVLSDKEDKGITLVQMGVSTASTDFTAANVLVTTAGAKISTANPEVKIVGDYVDDIAAESLVYIRRSAAKTKDKEQLDEEERQRISRAHKAASSFNIEEWEDIQARIEADEELAQRLQVEERKKYSKAKKEKLLAELINQRKRHFAQQRAEERRNKPPTQAQQRTYMSNYIKHMGSYTLQQLRGLQLMRDHEFVLEATMKRVNTFTLMESDVDRTVPKIAARSTKRAAEEELG
ncbi:hypothetical protein Tco_0901214 [Tanacetum coccineum]